MSFSIEVLHGDASKAKESFFLSPHLENCHEHAKGSQNFLMLPADWGGLRWSFLSS